MWAHGSNKHIHFLSSQHTPPRGEFILWLGLKPRGRREDGAYCVTYSRFISLCLVFLLSRLPTCCCKLWVTSFSLNRAVQIRTVNACDAIRKQVFNTHLKQKEKERKKRKKRASRVEKIWAWAQQTERCIASRQRTQKRFVSQGPHRSVSVFVFLLFALIWGTATEERKHLFLVIVLFGVLHVSNKSLRYDARHTQIWQDTGENATFRSDWLVSMPIQKQIYNELLRKKWAQDLSRLVVFELTIITIMDIQNKKRQFWFFFYINNNNK